MKFKQIQQDDNSFKPITIQVTFETKEEVDKFTYQAKKVVPVSNLQGFKQLSYFLAELRDRLISSNK